MSGNKKRRKSFLTKFGEKIREFLSSLSKKDAEDDGLLVSQKTEEELKKQKDFVINEITKKLLTDSRDTIIKFHALCYDNRDKKLEKMKTYVEQNFLNFINETLQLSNGNKKIENQINKYLDQTTLQEKLKQYTKDLKKILEPELKNSIQNSKEEEIKIETDGNLTRENRKVEIGVYPKEISFSDKLKKMPTLEELKKELDAKIKYFVEILTSLNQNITLKSFHEMQVQKQGQLPDRYYSFAYQITSKYYTDAIKELIKETFSISQISKINDSKQITNLIQAFERFESETNPIFYSFMQEPKNYSDKKASLEALKNILQIIGSNSNGELDNDSVAKKLLEKALEPQNKNPLFFKKIIEKRLKDILEQLMKLETNYTKDEEDEENLKIKQRIKELTKEGKKLKNSSLFTQKEKREHRKYAYKKFP